jgi:hypothetical protein
MSKDREEREGKGFTVNDHRRFEADGGQRDVPDREPSGAPSAPLPEIDFSTFILSLVTSAMVHLGEAPHPDGQVRKELSLAKQTIDILGMLREKTQGNLTDEELGLVDELLYDLRLRYVSAAR